MNIPKPKVKLPSKTRYMAQVNNFVPSNLHTQVQGSTGSLLSTASKTFPHNMFPQEVQSATLRRGNENENTENFDRTVKSNTETMRKPRVQSENKRKSVEEHQKKSSVLSGSSFSVQFSPVASKKNKKSQMSKGAKKKRESQSVSDMKRLLPGNYEAPEFLYKGAFQNNYMVAEAIEYKDQELYEVPVRNSYKYYEDQYKMHNKEQNNDFQSSHKHLESRLSLYKLIETEELNPLQENRKKITLSEKINDCSSYLNPNFLPSYIGSHQFPGHVGSENVVSEREKSAILLQKFIRGMLTRRRVRRMKNTLKNHFSGERELDPYELEFFDLNVPVFEQILSNNGRLPIKKENKTDTLKDDDPNKKILTNTFYSAIRNGFFPEDPMDYVVLQELQGETDAVFPKLLKEQEKKQSKEVMLAKKYEYLFGKPSVAREIKTDKMSVIGNFLKSNLDSISESDLKVHSKFQTDYKSTYKPKTQTQAQKAQVSLFGGFVGKSSPVSNTHQQVKRFDTQMFTTTKQKDHEIQSEISESYPDDFIEESGIKESIVESYRGGKDLTQSYIKDSIKESIIGGDSRGKDNYMNDSIRESIVDQSSPGRFDKRNSNKSISEDIIGESIRLGKNQSFKSIQEEIPMSESIAYSEKKLPVAKKARKQSEEISEDIDYKDSYGDEEFESLEEDIQESIEKFQSSRRGTTPSPNGKATSKPTITPQKVLEDRTISTKPMLKKFTTAKEEEISPITKIQPTFQITKTPEIVPKDKKESKLIQEFKVEVSDESFSEERFERRRPKIDPNLIELPVSNKADILFANFQKELEKMIYVESMTQNVKTLENTIENLYNQKEVNLLHSLQRTMNNQIPSKTTNNFNIQNVNHPSTMESNSVVFLMQKYNAMERSMAAISNQLNFLINNFTGGKAREDTSSVGSQRKPRPIIPVKKAQNIRRKEPSVSVATQEPKKVEQEIKPQTQPIVQKPKEVEIKKEIKSEIKPVEVKKVEEIKKVPEIPAKKIEVPIKKEEPVVSKPKFSFKLPTPQQNVNKSLDEEIEEEVIEEKIEVKNPVNFPIIPQKQEPEPIKVEEKLVTQKDEKASTYKSAKFGKWQESSSEKLSEEIVESLSEEIVQEKPVKKDKSSEEEVDFSVKEYSESFEKLSPMITPKRNIPSKFEVKVTEKILPQDTSSVKAYSESFEELTPKSSNKKDKSPLKTAKTEKTEKTETKKEEISEEYIDDFIDEEIDLPSDGGDVKEKEIISKPIFPTKVEPKVEPKVETKPIVPVTTTKPKEDEFENIEFSEEYGEEEFEELSIASEPKEEEKPKVETKPQVSQPQVEVSDYSDDIEASQEYSTISWQDDIFPPVVEKVQKIEPKVTVEKKAEKIPEVESPPKKNLSSPLGELKVKGKHANMLLLEHQNINIHQENTPVVEKETAEQLTPEEIKHKEHTNNIKNQVNTVVEKMTQAKKDQIIKIMINHINHATPEKKLTIFDKSPVKDEAIVDAYNEIFLNLFRSEFRKLSNEFANIKEVETRMQIKMNGLISKSKDILLKKSIHSTLIPTEDYQNLGYGFSNIYETLKNKKITGEENEFYEEEYDIKRLIEEENNMLKQAIADDVMEALFEETVRDLMRIAANRK